MLDFDADVTAPKPIVRGKVALA